LNRHLAIRAEPDIEAFKAAALRCPLPSAVELIGEKWAFLILRGALNGLQHFEQFQAALGIARNILSNRLAKLVGGEILDRGADPADRRKVIYWRCASGARIGAMAARKSSSPTSATADRSSGSASRPMTGGSSSSAT